MNASLAAVHGQLERELAYYRRECNDLGARLVRLQEEQSQAFREARRSRMVARLIREAYRLADSGSSPEDIGGPMLSIILDNAMCDRAALLIASPTRPGHFQITHAVGFPHPPTRDPIAIPDPPAFFFTTSQTRIEPPAYELTGIVQLPYVLWAHDRVSGQALVLGNRSESNVSRAFEPGDQELIEGALSVYLDVLTRKRAEVDLRAAKQAAEEANSAKAIFLAMLSHELRTPLNAIIGFSDTLVRDAARGLPEASRTEYAQQINESGHHLLAMINNILDYSSITRRHMSLNVEGVQFASVAEAAARAAAAAAAARGVTLKLVPVDRALGLRADRLRLRQVLDNLLSNAVKFTEAGGTVSLEARALPTGELEVSVRDTGIGMRPEDLPRALEPFQQVSNAFTRTLAGTGLGLPIAKELVEAHGGTLTIESAPDVGTTVRLVFPADRVFRQGEPKPESG